MAAYRGRSTWSLDDMVYSSRAFGPLLTYGILIPAAGICCCIAALASHVLDPRSPWIEYLGYGIFGLSALEALFVFAAFARLVQIRESRVASNVAVAAAGALSLSPILLSTLIAVTS